jgi:protochlorophyllide reductase
MMKAVASMFVVVLAGQLSLVQGLTTHPKFGTKKLVVITGTSSGLGKSTARALLRTGQYHVIGGVRDVDKMEVVAEIEGFAADEFTPMEVELNSYASVRKFCKELDEFKQGKPIDRLICNAGVYQPSLAEPKWSEDGHEQQMQINYLSHFLMVSLLLDDLSKAPDARVILVGSVTGNDNTVGGGGVYPIADLKDLEGLKAGARNPIAMFDGYQFIGAKVCLTLCCRTRAVSRPLQDHPTLFGALPAIFLSQ